MTRCIRGSGGANLEPRQFYFRGMGFWGRGWFDHWTLLIWFWLDWVFFVIHGFVSFVKKNCWIWFLGFCPVCAYCLFELVSLSYCLGLRKVYFWKIEWVGLISYLILQFNKNLSSRNSLFQVRNFDLSYTKRSSSFLTVSFTSTKGEKYFYKATLGA